MIVTPVTVPPCRVVAVVIALLDQWLADETGYDEETWPELKQALDRDRLTDLRGVLTPAAAMGDALLARFPKAGVSLDTMRLN